MTTLEDFPVELFEEIFLYLSFDQIFQIFSNLNSRFSLLIENIPFISFYVGLNGMSITATELNYEYFSQLNIRHRLLSLCVSDRLSIDNGLWLASHLGTLINLRHLSLIDIKRSSLQLILHSISSMNSLTRLSITFSNDSHATLSYIGVPEGAYYEQIFHLFPSLHVCHLLFSRSIQENLDEEFLLPSNQSFISIQSTLLHLQSLTLQCSERFLSYLFQYLPQLKQLNYTWTTPWLPEEHPLRHDPQNNSRIQITKDLAPNLRRLKMKWSKTMINVELINQLFHRDVLSSLTNFQLIGRLTKSHVLSNLISILSNQCQYSFEIYWSTKSVLPLLETNHILSDTFEQLKRSMTMELKLSLEDKMFSLQIDKGAEIDHYFSAYSYRYPNTIHGRTRYSSNQRFFNKNELFFSENMISKDKFDLISPSIVPDHQILSIDINQPFNITDLRILLSKKIPIRILTVHYQSEFDHRIDLKETLFVDLLNDSYLCDMFMFNGLKQVNLFLEWKQDNLLDIAHLIVHRLSDLETIELHTSNDQIIEMSHRLINGLFKLTFLTLIGSYQCAHFYDQRLRHLQNANSRSFRSEIPQTIDEDKLLLWLE